MGLGLPARTLIACTLVVLAALGGYLLNGDASAMVMAAVVGFAAVLLAAAPADTPATPAPPPAPPPAEPVTAELIEAIVEPVMAVTGTRVTEANRAARALLGDHIIGEDVRLAIRHPAASERLISRPDSDDFDPTHLVGLGTRDQRWVMRVRSLGDGRRIVHLADSTGTYATERIRVDFVANASHELRTPLSSLLGFIETLKDEAGDDPEVRARFLGVMFDEARRMQRLIDDLMSLSRIEAEKYRAPEDEIDLGELAREVCSELSATPDPRGEDLTLTVHRAPPVLGDRSQLSQLLHNVAGNAMKYGRAGTPVGIVVEAADAAMVRLTVTDEGDGIAPEHLPRLTERFYRIDSGRSRAIGGTGLGLAIVKHIVERHRGQLDIASQVGRGTTIAILLPAALSSARNATATEQA